MEQSTDGGTVNDAAKQLYGMLESQDQPAQEEAPEEASEEQVSDEETEEVSEEQPSEEQSEDQEAPEGDRFESIDELAEATGMEMEEFLDSVKTEVTVAGEKSKVNLKELRDGYQRDADYRRKTAELAEQRRSFDQEKSQLVQSYQEKLSEAESVIEGVEKAILQQYENVSKDDLEPGEYADLMQQKQQVKDWLKSQRSKVESGKQEINSELTQEQQAQLQQHLQMEQQKLQEKLNWSDQQTAQKEQQQIKEYLSSLGFSPDEVSNVYDHRIVMMARDAALYNQGKAQVETAKKKVKKVPKITRPGSPPSKSEIQREQRKERISKFKESGKVHDAAKLIESLLE